MHILSSYNLILSESLWNIPSTHLVFCFSSRYQIHATSHNSLLSGRRFQHWSFLFYHKIESGLSLHQNKFQKDPWMPFWTDQPHGQHHMYYPNTISPQNFRDAPPWIFSSHISASSSLSAVTSISPIMSDVFLFVSSSGEKSSLRSQENGKPYSGTHQ